MSIKSFSELWTDKDREEQAKYEEQGLSPTEAFLAVLMKRSAEAKAKANGHDSKK